MTAREPVGFGELAGAPSEPLELAAPASHRRRRWPRLSATGIFALGFVCLVGAVVAAGFAHFTASGVAPWLSVGLSGGAVICTVAALAGGRER